MTEDHSKNTGEAVLWLFGAAIIIGIAVAVYEGVALLF